MTLFLKKSKLMKIWRGKYPLQNKFKSYLYLDYFMSIADRKLKLTRKLVTSASVRAKAATMLVVNRSTVYYCIQSRVARYIQSWLVIPVIHVHVLACLLSVKI